MQSGPTTINVAEPFAHRTRLLRRVLYLPAGALAGFVLALIVTLFLGPEMYTSTAVLYEATQPMMEMYVAAPAVPPFEALLPRILSRANLTSVANVFGLSQRQSDRLDTDISIQRNGGPGQILIRYRNENRFYAQKVAQDIVSRIMYERIREASAAAATPVGFIKDRLGEVRKEWDLLYAERKRIDSEAARARYEELANKLAAAQAVERLPKEACQRLEIVDQANLPVLPDLSYWKVYLTGAALGAFAGMIFPVFFPARRSKDASPSGELV